MATSKNNLGRLERVDLREVWTSEPLDFTPWLAQEANLKLLGDTISIDLEFEALEKFVGPFRADILCKNAADGSWVLIENQLEKTDHLHLGQLMTYSAGLDAVTVVWIAASFTEEHRAALDWLNDITSDTFNFFGLEIELWRIAGSPVAPKFNIVCKPNDWSRSVSSAAQSIAAGELTETRKLQLEFWSGLHTLMQERGGVVRPTKPAPQNWQTFSIGRSEFQLEAFANSVKKRIGVMLVLSGPHAKPHFHLLHANRPQYEQSLGELEWREMPDKKQSRILLRWRNCDPLIQSEWPKQQDWLFEKLQAFHKAFAEPIKNLKADDYHPDEDGQ